MNKLFQNGSHGLGNVYLTIALGILIGLAFGVLKRIISASLGQGQRGIRWRLRLSIIERIYWPAYVVAVLMSIIVSRPLVGLFSSVLLILAFFHPMRNFILGLMYKIGSTYTPGQGITYNNQSGSIRTFNVLSMEVALEDGTMLDIPYSNFAQADIVRSSPKTGVLSHKFQLSISKPCDITAAKQKIRAQLLGMPYVLPDEKIIFDHISESSEAYLLMIIIHGVDKGHMYQVEGKIKALYNTSKKQITN